VFDSQVLMLLDISYQPSSGFSILCPLCQGTGWVGVSEYGTYFSCYQCGFSGDMCQLFAKVNRMPVTRAAALIAEKLELSQPSDDELDEYVRKMLSRNIVRRWWRERAEHLERGNWKVLEHLGLQQPSYSDSWAATMGRFAGLMPASVLETLGGKPRSEWYGVVPYFGAPGLITSLDLWNGDSWSSLKLESGDQGLAFVPRSCLHQKLLCLSSIERACVLYQDNFAVSTAYLPLVVMGPRTGYWGWMNRPVVFVYTGSLDTYRRARKLNTLVTGAAPSSGLASEVVVKQALCKAKHWLWDLGDRMANWSTQRAVGALNDLDLTELEKEQMLGSVSPAKRTRLSSAVYAKSALRGIVLAGRRVTEDFDGWHVKDELISNVAFRIKTVRIDDEDFRLSCACRMRNFTFDISLTRKEMSSAARLQRRLLERICEEGKNYLPVFSSTWVPKFYDIAVRFKEPIVQTQSQVLGWNTAFTRYHMPAYTVGGGEACANETRHTSKRIVTTKFCPLTTKQLHVLNADTYLAAVTMAAVAVGAANPVARALSREPENVGVVCNSTIWETILGTLKSNAAILRNCPTEASQLLTSGVTVVADQDDSIEESGYISCITPMKAATILQPNWTFVVIPYRQILSSVKGQVTWVSDYIRRFTQTRQVPNAVCLVAGLITDVSEHWNSIYPSDWNIPAALARSFVEQQVYKAPLCDKFVGMVGALVSSLSDTTCALSPIRRREQYVHVDYRKLLALAKSMSLNLTANLESVATSFQLDRGVEAFLQLDKSPTIVVPLAAWDEYYNKWDAWNTARKEQLNRALGRLLRLRHEDQASIR